MFLLWLFSGYFTAEFVCLRSGRVLVGPGGGSAQPQASSGSEEPLWPLTRSHNSAVIRTAEEDLYCLETTCGD